MPKNKPPGYVIWRGPSRFTGSPMVVIAVRKSSNSKTGNIVQVVYIRSDIDPVDALRSGRDAAACGGCPLRGLKLWRRYKRRRQRGPQGRWVVVRPRRCYVNVGIFVRSIYRAFKRGSYPLASPADARQLVAGRVVRLGAYGDAAAVPTSVTDRLKAGAAGWTSYTHSWRRRPSLRTTAMASVESDADARAAWAAGWRTFRVKEPGSPVLPGELYCPATFAGGRSAGPGAPRP
jgi:hypothetical protein